MLLVELIGSVVISLTRCCLPNDEGPGPPKYFFLEPPLNASPEWRFSVNNALVTKERGSLSEQSVVALRVVKEAIRLFGSCIEVPVTKAEEATRVDQRTWEHLHEQLAEQAQLEMAQIAEQETARQLISEAVQRKANNLQGAKVAQVMLSVGNEKLTACT